MLDLRHSPVAIFASVAALWLSGCTVDLFLGSADEAGEEDTSAGAGDGIALNEDEGPMAHLDLPSETPLYCDVSPGDLDAPPPCATAPTASQLSPVLARSWSGSEGEHSVLTTPLVLNFDDDNGDGSVDPCDRPDIIVVAVDLSPGAADPIPPGHVHVIDGLDASLRLRMPYPVDATVTPALADLDGDGTPELVTLEGEIAVPGALRLRRLVILDNDGQVLNVGDLWLPSRGGGAVSIADLDGDGVPEIIAPEFIADAHGQLLWQPSSLPGSNSTPLAIDLDDDGTREVLFGGSAYEHDGALRFAPADPDQANLGVAAVASFDDDPEPELYVQADDHRILEHDGSVKAHCPNGDRNPAAIADLDGDGTSEILYSYHDRFELLAVEGSSCSLLLSIPVDEFDARSSGTAFDLLGDGSAEMIYADRSRVRIFDVDGNLIFESLRSSRPSQANPVVADVDNDGAAELVIVSSVPAVGDDDNGLTTASVLIFENASGAFAPTRRVWNQHAYHVTNIREDGRLPEASLPSWLPAAGFRTNTAPQASGGLCQPPPTE